jgi:hypothetical protein
MFHSFVADFDKLQEGFRKKPTLEEKHISIKTVPVCKTILVKNLPTTATYDSVLYKFENKRAGGGEVKDGGVHLDLEKRIALVEFEDPNGKMDFYFLNCFPETKLTFWVAFCFSCRVAVRVICY